MKEKLFESIGGSNTFKLTSKLSTKKKLITENTLDATLYREDTEINVEVEYDVTSEEHGHKDQFGAQEEPDYPASIEIVSVTDKATGYNVELTSEEEDGLIQQINDEQANNNDIPEPEDFDPSDKVEYWPDDNEK